jgi:hypothetical protein
MFTQFVTVQLSREELQEIHAGLIQRAIVEDELRRERGQEPVMEHPLLQKLEMLLGEREEVLHGLDHALEDEMWEYAWYAFTDEWAWFRAKTDVEKELGAESKTLDAAAFEKLVEIRYQKQFEQYVSEIDMLGEGKMKKMPKKQTKAS